MLNIKSLYLGNFRVFSDISGIKLAPITILTGPNSSGKSSIAKSIFLMKNLVTNDVPYKVRFDATQNTFGGFDMIKNNRVKSDQIIVGYKLYNIILGENIQVYLTLEKKGDFEAIVKKITIHNNSGVLFDFGFMEDKIVSHLNINYLLQKLNEIKRSRLKYDDIEKNIDKLNPESKEAGAANTFSLNDDKVILKVLKKLKIPIIEYERLHYFFGDRIPYPFEKSSEDDYINKIKKIVKDFAEDDIIFNNELLKRILILPPKELNEQQLIALIKNEFPGFAENIEDNKNSDSLNQIGADLNLYKYNELENEIFHNDQPIISPIIGSDVVGDEILHAILVHITSQFENNPFFKAILDLTIERKNWGFRVINFPDNLKNLSSFAGLVFSKTIHDLQIDIDGALLIPLQYFTPGLIVDFNHPMHDLIKKYSTNKRKDTFLKDWLTEFKMCEDFSIETPVEGLGYSIGIRKNRKKISLSNEGTGTNHLMTMLLGIANARQITDHFNCLGNQISIPRTIVLEEPEANLHPEWQSKLADMFIDANKKLGLHFIIETHSEYIVRKLQYLVAKKQLNKDDVVIYYIDNPDQKSRAPGAPQVRQILIDSNGILSQEFGKGFFDEADNLAIDLFNLKKSQNN